MSPLEAAQLAHTVEIKLQTGLGTVAAEFNGGLEIRSEPGAPGFGKVLRIPVSDEYRVVALHNGPMSTSRLLNDAAIRAKINTIGGRLTDALLRDTRLARFLELSQEFTTAIGVANDELLSLMVRATELGYHLGMAMFGRTLFTVVRDSEVNEVLALLRDGPEGRVIVAPLDSSGAHRI